MRVHIIKAEISHIEEIKKLSDQYLIGNLSEEEKKQHGFLVSGFDESIYLNFIRRAEYFYVLSVNHLVKGFILAYTDNFLDNNDYLKREILKRIDKPFVLIKQICIDKRLLNHGYGREMYHFLFQRIRETPILAAIVIDPYNSASISFHDKLGFKKLFEFTPNDDIKRSMWIKD